MAAACDASIAAGTGSASSEIEHKHASNGKVGPLLHGSGWGKGTDLLTNPNASRRPPRSEEARQIPHDCRRCAIGNFVVVDASDRELGLPTHSGKNPSWTRTKPSSNFLKRSLAKALAEAVGNDRVVVRRFCLSQSYGTNALGRIGKNNRVDYFMTQWMR